MLLRVRRERRRGATMVETAFVLPLTFLIVVGLVVGALGVFRSQETAELARAAARYASVHGGNYTIEGRGSVTRQQIIDTAVTPRATALSPLTVRVQLVTPDDRVYDWDDPRWAGTENRTYTLNSPNGQGKYNRVRVTVIYAWMPEAYLVGPINLTSTSEMPMSY